MDWHNSTVAQRNAACAQFMPKSSVNPIRQFDLVYKIPEVDAVVMGTIPLQKPTIEAATAWLKEAKSSPFKWAAMVGEKPSSGGVSWKLREYVSVQERTWHVRYSDTPGGAWNLVEKLVVEGYAVTVRSSTRATSVAIDQYPTTRQTGFFLELPRPMPEIVAAAFLMFKGIEITHI
jgi:hypothetical protein